MVAIAAGVLVLVAFVASLVLEQWIDADNERLRTRLDQLEQK